MINFLGDKAQAIDIVANNGFVDDRTWKIVWRDDSIYGNDKSKSKPPFFFSLFLCIYALETDILKPYKSINEGT
jgi:hypothetical protein